MKEALIFEVLPLPLFTGEERFRVYSCDFVVHQGVVRGGLPFPLSPPLPVGEPGMGKAPPLPLSPSPCLSLPVLRSAH